MTSTMLGDLFNWGASAKSDLSLKIIGDSDGMTKGHGEVKGTPPESFWPGAAHAVSTALGDALQVDLKTVLFAAWNDYQNVQAYADPAQHSQTDGGEVALFRHTITSTHKPSVELVLNGKQIAKVEFEVELDLEIESAVLLIEKMKITELRMGKGTVTGSLSCGGHPLGTLPLGEIPLPGHIDLGEGIPIKRKDVR